MYSNEKLFKCEAEIKGKVIGKDETRNGAKKLIMKIDGVNREVYVSDETDMMAELGQEMSINVVAQSERVYLREIVQ